MGRRGLRRDPVKERFWRDAVRRREANGLSVREFCARHSLAEAAFYSWRAEIQRRDRVLKAATLTSPPADRPQFLPVAVTNVATTSPLEIALPSGVVLRVGRDCDRTMLRTVLGAVLRYKAEARAC
jgi:Transposase